MNVDLVNFRENKSFVFGAIFFYFEIFSLRLLMMSFPPFSFYNLERGNVSTRARGYLESERSLKVFPIILKRP